MKIQKIQKNFLDVPNDVSLNFIPKSLELWKNT